jgi:hypothetical protein
MAGKMAYLPGRGKNYFWPRLGFAIVTLAVSLLT